MNTFHLNKCRKALDSIVENYGYVTFLDYKKEDPTTRTLMNVLKMVEEARKSIENFCEQLGEN